ncbi:hypothetical protein F383_19923 [Gossypium arboreum]|uniref:Uncharacterized protein n=1 Tax=Gossypium arboreum TaxID=29729 RepID=A0A0B0NQB6_GOSAR|nr:hypothetical protein F383_19923 [Gossypium arboreum]
MCCKFSSTCQHRVAMS